jgi:hypothetical protein
MSLGNGMAEAGAAGWDVTADAWPPAAGCVAPAAQPASATTPRQATSSMSRRIARVIAASRGVALNPP